MRAVGLDYEEQEQRVRKFVRAHGRVERKNVMEICNVETAEAYRILQRMVDRGELELVGKGRYAFYQVRQ